jgi:hypothetical protein
MAAWCDPRLLSTVAKGEIINAEVETAIAARRRAAVVRWFVSMMKT